jgi:hypothetical protein
VKRALAERLQREIPTLGALPITWSAEDLYDAKGAYRTGNSDTYRWSGAARFTDTGNSALVVDSYLSMTECLKYQGDIEDCFD